MLHPSDPQAHHGGPDTTGYSSQVRLGQRSSESSGIELEDVAHVFKGERSVRLILEQPPFDVRELLRARPLLRTEVGPKALKALNCIGKHREHQMLHRLGGIVVGRIAPANVFATATETRRTYDYLSQPATGLLMFNPAS